MNETPSKFSKYLSVLGLILILCLWSIAKFNLFLGFEYTSDFFIHIQKSRSYLFGLPLLYDNIHGPHPYHNTFLQLLLGPFTAAFGGFGLIVPTLVLYGFSFLYLLISGWKLPPFSRYPLNAYLFAGLLGPVGFWMFDNPIYGWHPEVLVFPICLCFALALSNQNKKLVWGSGFALLLVHELGAVTLCCILISRYLILFLPKKVFFLQKLKDLGFIILPCFFLFICGIILQRYWDSAGANRLQGVLTNLTTNPETVLPSILKLWSWLFLLLTSCSFCFLFYPFRLRQLVIAIVTSLPLVVAGTAAGLAYTLDTYHDTHNIFWSPRFCFAWGIISAGVVFSAYSQTKQTNIRYLSVVLIALASILSQYQLLVTIRDYSVVNRFMRVVSAEVNSSQYSEDEKTFMECIRKNTPFSTRVYTNGFLWAAFHTREIEKYEESNPFKKKPEIIICDTAGRDPFPYNCQEKQGSILVGKEYSSINIANLSVRFADHLNSVVQKCVLNSN